jgi:antirestriction protein ArdC
VKGDLYEKITNKIVTALENGVKPWSQPWNAEHAAGRITRPLRSNGIPYNGINVLLLWAESTERGYENPYWCTYKQATDLGGQVRKGEKGSIVVYADKIVKKEEGSDDEKVIPFLKSYVVFNASQVDGLPAHFYATAAPILDPVQRIEAADSFVKATGADVRTGGNRAFYSPSTDHIQMPPFEAFRDAEAYHGVTLHELTHWAGGEKRLNRDMGKRFKSDERAMEELTAELGSCFLAADLGLSPARLDENAAYIESWLRVLKSDKRAVFTAASMASKAVEYLHGRQVQP